MSRKYLLPVGLVAIFVLFLALSVLSGNAAYAADVSIRDINRIIIDCYTVDEEGNEAMPDTDGTLTVTYGTTVRLHARADDNDVDNAKEIYDNVRMSFQWYYAPEGGDFSEYGKGNSLTSVDLVLTDCNQSGTYYVKVTELFLDGGRIGFPAEGNGMLRSDDFTVTVFRKQLSIEYTSLQTVYNGDVQEVGYVVHGEVPGKPADCRVDSNSSLTNAGSYPVTVVTQNENYDVAENSATFVIRKASLIISVGDVVVLAGYDYTMPIYYEGFCGEDDQTSLEFEPRIADKDRYYREAGFYEIYPYIPESDMNYELYPVPGTLQVNRSVLEGESLSGFSGRVTGSFSSDAMLSIETSEASAVGDVFKAWQVPSEAFTLRLEGTSNNETYTVVMEEVELSGPFRNICFVDAEGKTQTISSYKYDSAKKTLTLVFTQEQTSGTIVVYHNYLWVAIPVAVVVILIISLLIFHSHDRNKHKLNRLISGSAKVEADYYREKLGAYEENERRKL